MTYERFMSSEPIELKPFEEAFKLKRKMESENMWIMGSYTNIAVMSALDKVFNGKKATINFPDKPFGFEEQEEKELTQEQKNNYIDQLFGNLHLMQANFELNH